jgi:hypothetical protein
MIKFFRKTREKVLNEGRTSKYFKYALGEVILVVVGILIALQINTWNQQKNNQAILKQFLVEYKEELKLNIENSKRDIKFIEVEKEEKDKLLKNRRLDTIKLQSLELEVEVHYLNLDYSPTLQKRFENSQITAYGKYNAIFIELQELYGFQWPFFKKSLNRHNREVDQANEFWRYQQKSYELKYYNDGDTFIGDSIERKKELIKLLKSPIVRNILKTDFKEKEIIKRKIEDVLRLSERSLEQINSVLQ